MSVFGNNYPAGAEHDPSAPWNQEDSEFCDRCDGCGYIGDEDNERDCPDCGGTGEGETPSQRRARLAEEKADADYDREKDERE
jgi:DnaJ-class molecular chaperone